MNVHYDPEANILSMEISSGDIAYAKEVNNTIIHLNSSHAPVYIEILNASSFLTAFGKLKQTSGAKIKPAPSPSG